MDSEIIEVLKLCNIVIENENNLEGLCKRFLVM